MAATARPARDPAPSRPEAPLLVVGVDDDHRRRLVARLAALRAVRAVSPPELRDEARWIDHAESIALLGGADPADLDALAPLAGLPAGRALLLVAHDVPEPLLERALARLAPAQLVIEPAPVSVLRYAVSQLDARRGTAARRQHRPANVILGVSVAIRRLLDEIQRVAPTTASVLVLGETGTGKELVARAIHEQSARSDGPFVPVNCGAIPQSLLEAELFGFRRGAFTGAERDKEGIFAQAHGGTLFLDEVAELPLELQPKLLRALEGGEVRPLGDTGSRIVDVRVVCATNRELDDAVREGRFRQDLLYRLNTVILHVPPLRRRRVDIPFLAQHFAEEFGDEQARRIVLGEDFLETLADHDFPGNVRELRNAVERAIALSRTDEPISADALAEGFRRDVRRLKFGTLRDRVLQLEHEAIVEALQRFDGNRTKAAESLGLSRLGLRQKMRRLGLS